MRPIAVCAVVIASIVLVHAQLTAAPAPAGKPSGGAPAAKAPSPAPPPALGPRRPYTADEIKEIQETVKEVENFKKAADSYKGTVNGIVKRAYEKRRQDLLGNYGKKIRVEEAEERVRRIAAITLFEDFLRRYPNDRRWTPDVIFRLAELYFEKANDEYLVATERFEKDREAFDKGKLAAAPSPPKQDYSNTIDLHRKLIREFPNYRLVDGAYYLLGFCLSEMGELEKGNKAYLALVCKNEYRAPLTDEQPAPTAAPTAPEPAPARKEAKKPLSAAGLPAKPKFETTVYDRCVPLFPKSRFNAEAWVRVGEYHFDESQLGSAIAAYQRVLGFGPKDNAYYDEALYKLAWTYYRADRFIDAIKRFDELVVYADKEFERTGKYGSEMRPEAIQYLGISFSEEDWDGDTQPDAESGLQRIERVYGSRSGEKHVYEIYRRLADIYFNTTKYPEAIKVYKVMLQRWPYRAENPEIQDQVILALERERKFDDAIKEREEFTRLFGKNTEWERRNRNNPKAIKQAIALDEQALIQAAVYHHKLGQEMKNRAVELKDGKLLQQAANEYALAAKAYEKYLDRFPTTKNSYEIRYSLASCLYYSQRFLEAAKVFADVRDSNLDNRYREEAAFMATKSYEEQLELDVKAGKVPALYPLPKATDSLPSPIQPQAIPEVYKLWQASLDAYKKALPKSNKTPRLTYKAAEIPYRFLQFDEARKRLAKIVEEYCKDLMAIEAMQAILVTYTLEKNQDKQFEWASKLKGTKCGGGAAGAIDAIGKAKTVVDAIKFKRAQALMDGKKWDACAKAFLDIVERDPKSGDADSALFNVAVCYANGNRSESAAKTYERIYRDYPQSKHAGEAVWLTATNYRRFFEFDKAVSYFLILADGPRFKDNEHRVDAIYNAAVILENDQNYAKAAALFKRYAKQVGKPKEAAEAAFRAAMIYEKMGDISGFTRECREFTKSYGGVAGQGQYAVECTFRIAMAAKKKNDLATAAKYFKLTMSEFTARGQAPASDAAEYAGQAAFELAERKLGDFLKIKISGAANTLLGKENAMGKKAQAIKSEYERVLGYKRARWMLAAMYRFGTIYEHFARSVAEGYRTAPLPPQLKRLGQVAVDMYQDKLNQLLNERVQPLEDRAKKLYEECVKKAREIGVDNQYTDEAAKRLNAFDPTHVILREPKMETAIE
jgi:TolA-binding protein